METHAVNAEVNNLEEIGTLGVGSSVTLSNHEKELGENLENLKAFGGCLNLLKSRGEGSIGNTVRQPRADGQVLTLRPPSIPCRRQGRSCSSW